MISLYPNPTSDKITLKSDQTVEGDFEIIDPLGKLVQTGNCNGKEVEIDLNQLSSGNYILRLPAINWISRIVKN